MSAATELGWPVTITQRVVDVRQRHPMDTERLIGAAEFEAVAAACPQTSFIILNALGLEGSAMFAGNQDGGRQVMTDISRMTAVMGNNMGAMIEKYGAGSLVFGTGIPFNYPRPALLKMDVLQADAATKEAITTATWSGAGRVEAHRCRDAGVRRSSRRRARWRPVVGLWCSIPGWSCSSMPLHDPDW